MSVEMRYDETLQEADIVVNSGGRVSFGLQHDIKSAAIISLFSRIGWWADGSIGSGLDALTTRGKLSPSTIRQVEAEAARSLRWMVDDKIAESVTVSSERDLDRLFLSIIIRRLGEENGESDSVTIRWEALSGT